MRFVSARTSRAALALALCLPASAAFAQNPRLDLSRIERFGDKATESVDVDIDERLIGMAASFLKGTDPDEKQAREILSGVKGIYVRHYEFDAEGQYVAADVDALRQQLKGSGWVRMVQARSKRAGDNADIFMAVQGDVMTGLAIVVSNPKEITVVNLVGTIDPDKIQRLSGNFGVPDLEVDAPAKLEKRP